MKGILNILKPPNMTSHDIVSVVRKKINLKKVGHTGTLDPMAVGVLPVCIGKATKIIEYLQHDTKVYRAELTLGRATDTQDRWGNIISESPVNVTEDDIIEVFNNFKGEQFQIPPMYSALKHKGKKLYELAREGKEIEREARKITIFYLNILKIVDNRVLFDVKCSKGTYIRTLCHDIGQALGPGAHMSFLERLESGVFKLENTITVEELNEADIDRIENKYLYNIDYPLQFMPRVNVRPYALKFILNGVTLKENGFEVSDQIQDGDIVRLYVDDKFIALGIYYNEAGMSFIKMKKLFS
ncbi:tRNA pseudouridine(55) synthase TruB [Wukongibacter baidiensis]|uniref:tRNA pseudouridine(55) synthase TruB n=1 Tax=Wukongibacter baidiensis TaxID=1723361 RepID=UPI003D7F87AF